jgi:hypothetical protein
MLRLGGLGLVVVEGEKKQGQKQILRLRRRMSYACGEEYPAPGLSGPSGLSLLGECKGYDSPINID